MILVTSANSKTEPSGAFCSCDLLASEDCLSENSSETGRHC